MKSLNRVFLIGHLGRTPELQTSKSGKPFTRLSLATNKTWMSASEERQESTEWHSIFVWGTMAETCVQWLKSGALIFVEGSLSYWQVAGQGEYKNAIQAMNVHFLNIPRATKPTLEQEILDNEARSINHNAVAH